MNNTILEKNPHFITVTIIIGALLVGTFVGAIATGKVSYQKGYTSGVQKMNATNTPKTPFVQNNIAYISGKIISVDVAKKTILLENSAVSFSQTPERYTITVSSSTNIFSRTPADKQVFMDVAKAYRTASSTFKKENFAVLMKTTSLSLENLKSKETLLITFLSSDMSFTSTKIIAKTIEVVTQ